MSWKPPYIVKPPHDQASCEYCAWLMSGKTGGVGPANIHADCAGHAVLELLRRVHELERQLPSNRKLDPPLPPEWEP